MNHDLLKEIQKRPFLRPLFLWVIGILLTVYIPVLQRYSVLFLLPVASMLIISFCTSSVAPINFNYRWLWGFSFACLIVFFSVQHTEQSIRSLDHVSHPSVIRQRVLDYRQKLVNEFDRLALTREQRSIAASIVLGDRSAREKSVVKKFTTSGVAHVLAVSGFHVGIIYLMLSYALCVLPLSLRRRLGPFVALVVIWLYTLLTGLSGSTLRAALMLSVFLVGQLLGRSPEPFNTLAAAAFIMLFFSPLLWFDIGFQLSFMAVFFIFLLYPRISRILSIRNPLIRTPWQWITLSFSAQLGVMPLCLYYFGSISTLFLLSTIPITLLTLPLFPIAIIWLLCPPSFFLSSGLGYVLQKLLAWMIDVVTAFSQLRGASIQYSIDFWEVILFYIIFFSLYWKWIKKRNYYKS